MGGGVTGAAHFMLAPMAELSHRGLRELVEGFGGCDEYFTEMISAGALLAGGPFEKWYVDNGPCPEKLVYQIEGHDAETMARAAGLLVRDKACLGIDLNMGCAAPAILRKGAGAAWMRDIDAAGDLAAKVKDAMTRAGPARRLSVKLRLGLDGDAYFDYLVKFCRRLEYEGVDLITLHPRFIHEKFRRAARWDLVGQLRGELRIAVAGNGDLANAAALREKAGGGAVMAGRGAVQCPWIFAAARGGMPLSPSIEETGLRFLDLLAQYQPEEFHLSRARRFFGFFCRNLVWAHYVFTALCRETALAGMARVWQAHFRLLAQQGG
ncbi:MAG: tRNA-dihydrouridine synthase family protein [Treponema sp.]|jgi:tRNA-dihydrouridine synthase|nr:tRNA-dihydrouridine synthase family protein [Treponema sp.]